jgi:hypothetical protein
VSARWRISAKWRGASKAVVVSGSKAGSKAAKQNQNNKNKIKSNQNKNINKHK